MSAAFFSASKFLACEWPKNSQQDSYYLELNFFDKVKVHTEYAQAKNLTAKNTRADNFHAKKALAENE